MMGCRNSVLAMFWVAFLFMSEEVQVSARIPQKNLNASLFKAVENNDLATVRSLVARGAHANARRSDGDTVLVVASGLSDVEIVKFLLKHGARIDEAGQFSGTPLMSAISAGQTDIALLLLARGSNIRARDDGGLTPLYYSACRDDTTSILRELIKMGANVNDKINDGTTPLMTASAHAIPNNLQVLLDSGAKVDIKDERGQTALHIAAMTGRSSAVRNLVQKHAQVNVADADGRTPLMAAVLVGAQLPSSESDAAARNVPMFGGVINQRAEDYMRAHKTGRADTNAVLASTRRDFLEVVRSLLGAGADAHLADNGGKTALTLASNAPLKEVTALVSAAAAKIQPDQKAEQLIEEMKAAYRSLRSLKANVVSRSNLNGAKSEDKGIIELQKPNFARAQYQGEKPLLIANSRVVRMVAVVPGKYVEQKPDPKGQNIQASVPSVVNFFFGQPILESFIYNKSPRHYAGTERRNGKLYYIVEFVQEHPKGVTRFYLGEDKLIYRRTSESKLSDSYKTTTEDELTNVVLNKKIPMSEFK